MYPVNEQTSGYFEVCGLVGCGFGQRILAESRSNVYDPLRRYIIHDNWGTLLPEVLVWNFFYLHVFFRP